MVTDAPASQPGHSIKVLHIEDDLSVAKSVARLLRLHGYEVISAASGDEAIQMVENALIPDLIPTDYYLPLQMTDDQVVIEIAARLGFKPPTMFLASAPGIGTYVADRVFSKPADMDAVVREIERLIGTRR